MQYEHRNKGSKRPRHSSINYEKKKTHQTFLSSFQVFELATKNPDSIGNKYLESKVYLLWEERPIIYFFPVSSLRLSIVVFFLVSISTLSKSVTVAR